MDHFLFSVTFSFECRPANYRLAKRSWSNSVAILNNFSAPYHSGHEAPCHQRRGWSLVELLVVIGIIGLLGAISLPAVQMARESARHLHCENNLRQVGLGTLQFEGARGHFPTGGWGWQWVADQDVPTKYGQPGGWIYQLLPYLEAGNIYDLPQVAGERKAKEARIHELLATPCTTFECPSRGNSKVVSFNSKRIPKIFNLAETPARVALTDYAANGGTKQIFRSGPEGRSSSETDNYSWARLSESNGMMLYHNRIRAADVTAGLSNVLWVGEKFVGHLSYDFDQTGGNDQSLYSGECTDIRRYASSPILRESVGGAEVTVVNGNLIETAIDYGSQYAFGTPHPVTMSSLMADGSTRRLDLDIDLEVFRCLSMRHNPKR